jgi:PAS domain S-box-containing protein
MDNVESRLIDASLDCVKVLDLDGRLLSMNAGGMAILEVCDLPSIVGTSWIDFWQGADREAARSAVTAARAGGTGRFLGYFPTVQTATPKWWEVTVTPILDGGGRPERLLAVSHDVTQARRYEELLHTVVEGTATSTGREFFRSLVTSLAQGLRLKYSFIAECEPDAVARTLAFWDGDRLGEDFSYPLSGTPCQEVVGGRTCFHPSGLQQRFPEDTALVEMQAESYLGVPVLDSERRVIGHLVVIDDGPMAEDPMRLSVLETFAARAGAELERMRAYEHLQRLHREQHALIAVNRAIARHLERDELFGALAESLQDVVSHDRFGIELPIDGDRLRGHLLTPGGPDGHRTRIKVLSAEGTACHWVMSNRRWLVAPSRDELRDAFPTTFAVMKDEGMESLAAFPLVGGDRVQAAMFFMSATAGAYAQLRHELLEQVSGAAAAALDNCLAHEELRRKSREALAESEQRYRDLFDEAPIAYVHEGIDTRFIRANRTAMAILGITPDQVTGTYGRTFIPDTPEAQRRLKEAIESIGRGTDTSGVVLELRRRDNGDPIWIQWWSRPDPSGTYTRTMFIDITERVLMEREKERLQAQNIYLQEEIRSEHNFEEIVGGSRSLVEVLRQVDQVAPADSTALITGETGTGKELIARAIHDRSGRRARPLVKVNCGAISAGLVESELFGHVKGAFTGALANRDGRFKVADGGTIFLDEVGELPLDVQVKLLRVLQEQEFEPIGSSRTVKVDVRVIAATNRDLAAAAAAGRFRGDLYYRLNVFPIHVPPLRERAADVPLLVAFFLQKLAKKYGRSRKQVTPETMARLTSYDWPGNIRELQNVIERAVLVSPGDTLVLAPGFGPTPGDTMRADRAVSAPASAGDSPNGETARPPVTLPPGRGALEEVERQHIESVLRQTEWVIEGERGAARILSLSPSTLRSRMQKLGIRRPGRPA